MSKVASAKEKVDKLHEYVKDRKHVHTVIKDFVLEIRATLGPAVREFDSLSRRVAAVEKELAATRNAQAATRNAHAAVAGMASQHANTPTRNKKQPGAVNTAFFTPKRSRSSPPELGPGGSKKRKNSLGRSIETPSMDEEGGDEDNPNPWFNVDGKGRVKTRSNKPRRRKFKEKKKGEALIMKTSENAYEELLRTVRSVPELAELGADVQKIRRTRAGEMMFELKQDSKTRSSVYKELTERVLGENVKVRAMCPEANLKCEDLDEVTTEDELKKALKEQCEIGDVEMSIRLRKGPFGTQVATLKLPIDAANKALEIGKIKVGWSVCSLSIFKQPERCFKCLEYGHQAWNCKGPDRSKLCIRCGGSGHKIRDCKEQPKCLICANEASNDHVTGGPRCPAFKKASAPKSKWR